MSNRLPDVASMTLIYLRFLIITYNTSIQVYSTADSLLVRRIPINLIDSEAPKGTKPATIVATKQSKLNANYIWVACSNGTVYQVDWTSASKTHKKFETNSKTAKALVTAKTGKTESVIVAESDKSTRMELVAYEWSAQSEPASKTLVTFKKPGTGLQILEASGNAEVLVGAINDRLFLGSLTSQDAKTASELQYDFFSFDAPDLITTVDVRIYKRSHIHKKSKADTGDVVDVLMGGARGGIYLYHDAVARCRSEGETSSNKESLHAQKFHWHRRAVHAVKWSRDGAYMISGGSENSLVIWQMDTAKRDYLPHLSGSIENLVVSADGSSYVVHLDDNSTMILSTAEMRPTAYVSGIQSAVTESEAPKDLLVKRVWGITEEVNRPIPAAIRATDPSRLHVCVGNGRQATMSGALSAPLLQTVDLESFSSVSRQALARTQPTDMALNNKGYTVDEPLVTHVSFSGDGRWLASVDDWRPPTRDIEHVTADQREQFLRERREIYLKFWEVQEGSGAVGLVSRVNGPHSTNVTHPVLDLATDAASNCFATIGGDGVVRVWRPRTKLQNGQAVKGPNGNEQVTWACSDAIALGEGLGANALVDPTSIAADTVQGRIAFSEDGSTILAAFGSLESGTIHIIDASTGTVVKTLEGMWDGRLHSLQMLSQYIISLSKDLRVYDIVSDELRYGIAVPQSPASPELLQLVVDRSSGHFAVTLPTGQTSSIGIFSPATADPVLVRHTPNRVISVAATPDATGFIALDDAAQVWTITEGSDPSSIATAQPLQDLNLEGVNGTENGDDTFMAVDEDEEDEQEQVEAQSDDEMDVDDAVPTSVVSQQSLADIFDASPAFAAPSIEDMFYKVTSLLATKPLSKTEA